LVFFLQVTQAAWRGVYGGSLAFTPGLLMATGLSRDERMKYEDKQHFGWDDIQDGRNREVSGFACERQSWTEREMAAVEKHRSLDG
jgi:hypothetical protein